LDFLPEVLSFFIGQAEEEREGDRMVAACSSASPPVDLPTLEAYRTYFTW
jgi:hypothetical protein